MKLMFDLMPLALQTDSSRVISMMLSGSRGIVPVPGVTLTHHSLSHHGQEPAKIEQLRKIEEAFLVAFADFLTKLKSAREGGDSLLGNTTILFGGNLGNASSHSTIHLPIIVAGGRFKHGQHLVAAPQEDYRVSKPISQLFVSMLQSVGVEADKFAHTTGTLTGIEPAV